MPMQRALEVKLVDPEQIAEDIRKRVLSKAASVARKHIRRETPKRTGSLRSHINRKVWRDGSQAAVYAKKPHAHLVIGGTKPHWTPARKGHHLKIGGHIIGSKVWHPGARANDFFTRGAENSRSEVMAAIANIVGEANEPPPPAIDVEVGE